MGENPPRGSPLPPATVPPRTSSGSDAAVRSNITGEDVVDPESPETRNQEAEAANLIKGFLAGAAEPQALEGVRGISKVAGVH